MSRATSSLAAAGEISRPSANSPIVTRRWWARNTTASIWRPVSGSVAAGRARAWWWGAISYSATASSGSRRASSSVTSTWRVVILGQVIHFGTRSIRDPKHHVQPGGGVAACRRACGYTRGAVIPLHDDSPTRRFPAVTVGLIAANVAVFVVQLTLPRWGITTNGWYYLLGVRPFELTHHVDLPPFAWFPGWATLFTSMFVHGGWAHLIFNMWYLWIFGNNVEDAMTRPRYLVFYLVCGLLATATQVLVAPGADVPLIGASGAIAGVLGGYLVLFPRARVLTVIPLIVVWPVFEVPAWILLLVWFAHPGRERLAVVGLGRGRRRVLRPRGRVRRRRAAGAALRAAPAAALAPRAPGGAAGAGRRV